MAEGAASSVVFVWSGGKDAAMALHEVVRQGHEVCGLVTTIDRERQRSSMHGLRRGLLETQAAALGTPIDIVELPPRASNEAYETAMIEALETCRRRGIDAVCYGDIHLEEVRSYREDLLATVGLDGRWPLWGRDTTAHAEAVIDAGFEAIVVALDEGRLDPGLVGRRYDRSFLSALPDDVDPAGEDGAFHTVVLDGPPFEEPVAVSRGEAVTRPVGDELFRYLDLHPAA
ncbi:MAG: diphthine--ammonia ligase [Halobacteriota archaeon]